MINGIKVFDCTLREVGYQTGWNFDVEFSRGVYKFAQGKGIDYVELGFFHNVDADPGRGAFRYCSVKNDEIMDVFHNIKNFTKLSAMQDVQRPLTELLPKNESPIDTVRLLTRSHETDFSVLDKHVDDVLNKGYECFINFTSAGYNSNELNIKFAEYAVSKGVSAVEFADTESVMTEEYVKSAIAICHDAGIQCGVHLHDKNGTADALADVAIECKADYIDVTHLGLGGKWKDGNLTMEYFLRKMGVSAGYEATVVKNELIDQLIKYVDESVAE